MDVIINIQTMKKVIDTNYCPFKDFKNLEKLDYDTLHEMQNNLIPFYNNSLKTK